MHAVCSIKTIPDTPQRSQLLLYLIMSNVITKIECFMFGVKSCIVINSHICLTANIVQTAV